MSTPNRPTSPKRPAAPRDPAAARRVTADASRRVTADSTRKTTADSARKATPAPVIPREAPGSTWARVSSEPATSEPATRAKATRAPKPPQRRAETALTDAARGTASALGLVLGRARTHVVDPIAKRRDEREAERRSAKRRRLAIIWGRRAGYVIVAGAALWLVLLSPVFALDPAKVTVSGYGTVVDPTEVRAVIDAQEGASLATLSMGHVVSDLEDIPGVREAHVQRSWPDGLTVTLESREPVAAVPELTGGFAFVDDEGVQVGRANTAPKDLPTLLVPTGEAGVKPLKAALTVLNAMPADLLARITSISAQTEDSVKFELTKGPAVEWGSAEDNAVKAQVLAVLLESKQARKADVIDVSAPTLPITKNN